MALSKRLVAVLAVIAGAGVVAAGQGFRGVSATGAWHRGQRTSLSIDGVRQALRQGSPWLDLLKVSDVQRVELYDVWIRHEAALRRLDSDRTSVYEAVSSAFAADAPDMAGIERARSEALALSERAIDESAGMIRDAMQILTPEQRRKLVELWRAR